MPAHINNASKSEYSVEDIRAYCKAELRLAQRPEFWGDDNYELEMFFDTGHPVITNRPKEFVDFCQVYDDVRRAAAKVGVEEDLTERMLRALARNLYYGSSRQEFYEEFLKKRIDLIKTDPRVYSINDVEDQYQYYLYCKENHCKGRDDILEFDDWKANGGCSVTFYSIMSRKDKEA